MQTRGQASAAVPAESLVPRHALAHPLPLPWASLASLGGEHLSPGTVSAQGEVFLGGNPGLVVCLDFRKAALYLSGQDGPQSSSTQPQPFWDSLIVRVGGPLA